ncbi:MAG: hemolysin family protein [Acidobacteriota bacterium]
MIFELLLWVLFLVLACAGNAARTVAASVRDLQPTLLAARATRLRVYKIAGGALSIIALAFSTALVVLVSSRGGDINRAALIVGISVLIVQGAAEIARIIAHGNMDRLARPFLGDAAVFLPLIEPHPESVEPEVVREEALEQMVDVGEKVGLIESNEHEMISGVIRLDRTMAREIMVPRMDMVALDIEMPLVAALNVIVEGAHSRVPIYEDNVDHIAGLLYAKDLLRTLRDGRSEVPLREVLRPAHFVPESMPVNELLQELQESKVHMAIVVDEYGGTAGVVTIEDVLEEIVGEIQDEYDVGEEPLVEQVSENEAVFDARVTVDDVNDALSVQLPHESDTLAGLVYRRLQKMPKVGDQVHLDGLTISVLSVAGRRIKKVRVSKNTPVVDEIPDGASTPVNSGNSEIET